MKFSVLGKCTINAAVLGLMAVTIAGCGGGGGDDPSSNTASGKGLLPLSATSFSMREAVARNGSDEVWCMGQPVATQFGGVSVVPLVTPNETMYFQLSGTSIKMWNGTEMATFLPSEIKVGDTWTFSQRGSTLNCTVLPRETVTVPAGTFNDCWVIRMVDSSSNTVNTLWFVVNAGLIKQSYSENSVLQSQTELVARDLVSSQSTGANLMPLDRKSMTFARSKSGSALDDFSFSFTPAGNGLTWVDMPTIEFELGANAGAILGYTGGTTAWTMAPAQVQAGTTWPVNNGEMTSGKILRIETVSVPAGTFSCFVIEYAHTMGASRWWCSPGIGIVKYELPDQFSVIETGVLKTLNMPTNLN